MDGSVEVSGVMAGGFGHGVPAGVAQDRDDEVAQPGHDLGCVARRDLGLVLSEGDVTDPVEAVLDAPVALDPGGQDCGGRGAGVGR